MARRTVERIETRCVIAGGGPAGVMAGYILARAGVEVLVLEKHRDFFRDFRGDTVHPSTLDVLSELGLLDAFLARPHQELAAIQGDIEGRLVALADFSHLATRCKFIAFMPQWDFLDLLAEAGRELPNFRLMMQAEATDILEEDGRVVGVAARTPKGSLAARGDLVIVADGRSSVLREKAGLRVKDIGAPIDVLWMRLSKKPSDGGPTLGRLHNGRFLVSIDRGDYWQCAYVIFKRELAEMRAQGIAALRKAIASAAPIFEDRVAEIRTWDDVRLLTVKIDRLERWWRPGLICIGDAAHAMSPIGGVGINLAIQDAVAAANRLAVPLRDGGVAEADLAAIQARRTFPTEATQAVQVFVQNRVISRILIRGRQAQIPLPFRLLDAVPVLRRLPAQFIGVGARAEHVDPGILAPPERGAARARS
jgi:2-polyprenyl-6-methoxyphenol hydroxylase-like FAD-dependent oxidoreductase